MPVTFRVGLRIVPTGVVLVGPVPPTWITTARPDLIRLGLPSPVSLAVPVSAAAVSAAVAAAVVAVAVGAGSVGAGSVVGDVSGRVGSAWRRSNANARPGWAKMPTAADRRTSTGPESPSAAKHSATRFTVARNDNKSNGSPRAINIITCSSPCRANHTSRRAAARSSTARAATGSAVLTVAAKIASNRDQAIVSINPTTPASTTPACTRDRCRVAAATCRAFHDRTRPPITCPHNNGNRCRRSNASAIRCRAPPGLVANTTANSAGQYAKISGVPSPPTAIPYSPAIRRRRTCDPSTAGGTLPGSC